MQWINILFTFCCFFNQGVCWCILFIFLLALPALSLPGNKVVVKKLKEALILKMKEAFISGIQRLDMVHKYITYLCDSDPSDVIKHC